MDATVASTISMIAQVERKARKLARWKLPDVFRLEWVVALRLLRLPRAIRNNATRE